MRRTGRGASAMARPALREVDRRPAALAHDPRNLDPEATLGEGVQFSGRDLAREIGQAGIRHRCSWPHNELPVHRSVQKSRDGNENMRGVDQAGQICARDGRHGRKSAGHRHSDHEMGSMDAMTPSGGIARHALSGCDVGRCQAPLGRPAAHPSAGCGAGPESPVQREAVRLNRWSPRCASACDQAGRPSAISITTFRPSSTCR